MGINRGSLYDTFGDKRSLFIAAIAHYEKTVIDRIVATLEAPGASKTVIVELFCQLAKNMAEDTECRGCFLTNTTMELCIHDADTTGLVTANLQKVERAFKKALLTAKAKGEITNQQDLDSLAQYLTSSIQGLRVMSKVNRQSEYFNNIIKLVLLVLD